MVLAALIAATALATSRPGLVVAHQASPTAGIPCPTTTEEENAALVRHLFEEGWGAGNLQVVDEVVADDVIVHRAPDGRQYPPHDVRHPRAGAPTPPGIQAWLTDFPDLHVAVEELIAGGETVAMGSTTFGGTQADPDRELEGAPKAGAADGSADAVGVSRGWRAARWPRTGCGLTT